MTGKKSSLLIDKERIIKSFEFINEGSKILHFDNENYLIFNLFISNNNWSISFLDKDAVSFSSV